jgi:hypothetical protein
MVDASKRRSQRLACYIPVAAVGLEFVWIFVLFLARDDLLTRHFLHSPAAIEYLSKTLF